MTEGIDLALGLIERDLGQQAAQRTARVLVIHHRRAGGQSQHSAMLPLDAKSDRVQNALAFAKQDLREPLMVELLADAARLSPRQFSRVFRAEPVFRLQRQLKTFALRLPGSCSSKAGCQSRKLLARRDLAIVSECGAVSFAPSAPRPKPFATRRIRWRPSNRHSCPERGLSQSYREPGQRPQHQAGSTASNLPAAMTRKGVAQHWKRHTVWRCGGP